MKFTVKRLLANEQLQQARLVAGVRGMGNPISGINMMDNPQSFEWLMPGDLVLTTGFVFKDDSQFQRKVIKELAEANCAALALKPRKYFGEVPREMIETAEIYGLPIVEIPAGLSLAQFSNIVNKEIFRIQDSLVQKTLYIHEKLTDISLAGGGIEEILKELAFVIKNPVLLLDQKGRILGHQDWRHSLAPFYGELLSLEDGQRVSPVYLAELPKGTAGFKKSLKKVLNVGGKDVVCRVLPIKALQELLGYAFVFETVSKLERIDYIAIEKAATIIALDILKKKEIQAASLRMQNDFFQDLLAGNVDSERELTAMADRIGLAVNGRHACIVFEAKMDRTGGGLFQSQDLLKEAEGMLRRKLEEKPAECQLTPVFVFQGKRAALIVQLEKSISIRESKEMLRKLASSFERELRSQFPDYQFRFGIGRVYTDLRDVFRSREEAVGALEWNRESAALNSVSHYDDYLVQELLRAVANQELLAYFYENTLQPLDEYDQVNNTALVETLRAYCDCQGNVGEAARALYIHRNTMLYRVDKIMTILEVNLRDAGDLLRLQLGLGIRELLNKQ